ncbi:YpfN family protein [Lonsdalea britannica]|uniref:YpfN family protein n=1 Tax=Lonsdalea britannica TaxID=1082704 RepID=UPI0026EBD1EE|nr:YpfN family protein [Lonsdalea britannica]
MAWLADYWWIILLILVGMLINGIKDLSRVDYKRFLKDKPELPPHRDNNAQWDEEDDWPKEKKQDKKQDEK